MRSPQSEYHWSGGFFWNPRFQAQQNATAAPINASTTGTPSYPSSFGNVKTPKPAGKAVLAIVAIVIILAVVYLAYTHLGIKKVTQPPINTTKNTTKATNTTSYEISSCTTISSPGTYSLSGDIQTTNTKGPCIDVKSNNVAIKGNNKYIQGSGPYIQLPPYSYGIELSGVSNVSIYNLSFARFSYDIYLNRSSDALLSGVAVANATISGIYLNNTTNSSVRSSKSEGSSSQPGGVVISGGGGNKVVNSLITQNSYYGIGLNSRNNSFVNDTVELNNVDLSCSTLANFSDSNLFSGSRCYTSQYCNFAYCSTSNKPSSLSSVILPSKVSTCGVIRSPGTYQLENNLNINSYINTSNPLSSESPCIAINSPNVKLECNNNQISNAWYGVLAQNTYNITVSGCKLYNTTYGIYLSGIFSGNVTGTTATKSTYGIYLANDTSTTVSNSTYSHDTYGVYTNELATALFNGVNSNNNTYGIYLNTGSQNTFLNNKLFSNTKGDFYCSALEYNSSGNSFQGNQCGVTDCNWASCNQRVLPPITSYAISNCGTISVQGNYSMPSAILSAQLNCITIKASNVAFNCRGNILNGPGSGSGFLIENASNVTVKNCRVQRYTDGVAASGTKYLTLSNMSIQNVSTGISLANSNFSQIFGVKVALFSKYGFNSTNLDNGVLKNDTASSGIVSATGFALLGSDRNLLTQDTASSNPDYGFQFNNSIQNAVYNNTALSNGNTDYSCSGSSTGIYAETGLTNTGITKSGCIWLVETDPQITQQCSAISSSATVTLTEDMLYTVGESCYNIYDSSFSKANNTVINCNHHTVLATNGGIFADVKNATGVTIENCYLRGFTTAIESTAPGTTLLNDTIFNSTYAASFSNTTYPSVTNVFVTNSSYGIYSQNTKYGTIQNNRFTNVNASIEISGGMDFKIFNNTASRSSLGLYLINTQDNLLQNNHLTGSLYGIDCAQYSTNQSSNIDQGGNVCSSNNKCAWMTSSIACAPS